MIKTILNHRKLFLILGLVCLLAGNLAQAHNPDDTGSTGFWTPGQPIVTCGITSGSVPDSSYRNPCDRCQLLHLLRHLIDLVLVFLAPVLGTLFFIVAGVMIMLGGDNPGLLSRGKSIFKNTFIGIAIIFMAWLITNTVIQTFSETYRVGEGGSWWTFSCSPTIVPI